MKLAKYIEISWKFETKFEIKVKLLLKMVNLKDFLPIFCLTAHFLPGGGVPLFLQNIHQCNMKNNNLGLW